MGLRVHDPKPEVQVSLNTMKTARPVFTGFELGVPFTILTRTCHFGVVVLPCCLLLYLFGWFTKETLLQFEVLILKVAKDQPVILIY